MSTTYQRRITQLSEMTDEKRLRRAIEEATVGERACRKDARNAEKPAFTRAHARDVMARWRHQRLTASRRLAELMHGRCSRCGQQLPQG